jgi:hypothetical protein
MIKRIVPRLELEDLPDYVTTDEEDEGNPADQTAKDQSIMETEQREMT